MLTCKFPTLRSTASAVALTAALLAAPHAVAQDTPKPGDEPTSAQAEAAKRWQYPDLRACFNTQKEKDDWRAAFSDVWVRIWNYYQMWRDIRREAQDKVDDLRQAVIRDPAKKNELAEAEESLRVRERLVQTWRKRHDEGYAILERWRTTPVPCPNDNVQPQPQPQPQPPKEPPPKKKYYWYMSGSGQGSAVTPPQTYTPGDKQTGYAPKRHDDVLARLQAARTADPTSHHGVIPGAWGVPGESGNLDEGWRGAAGERPFDGSEAQAEIEKRMADVKAHPRRAHPRITPPPVTSVYVPSTPLVSTPATTDGPESALVVDEPQTTGPTSTPQVAVTTTTTTSVHPPVPQYPDCPEHPGMPGTPEHIRLYHSH